MCVFPRTVKWVKESDPSTLIVWDVISVTFVGPLYPLILMERVTCYYGYIIEMKDGRFIMEVFKMGSTSSHNKCHKKVVAYCGLLSVSLACFFAEYALYATHLSLSLRIPP